MFTRKYQMTVLLFFVTVLLLFGYTTNIHAKVVSLEGEIVQGRFLVPMRGIFEALGASVHWDGDTRTVTGNRAGTTVLLSIDSKIAQVNDNTVELDVPATIVEGRTYVPLRFISESLGANVSWDGERRVATITEEGRVIQVREKLSLPENKTIRLYHIDGYDDINLTLHISDLGYLIYYSKDYYRVTKRNGIDRFEYFHPDWSVYFVEIWREESNHIDVTNRIKQKLADNYKHVSHWTLFEGAVSYSGLHSLRSGYYPINYHIFENPHGGCFVITDNFTAASGEYLSVSYMIKEFKIIE